ncbi:BolA family transcriptional regulator [Candidatus Bealeia paramacronuclearis]|uniref:BolA family transcriptional regulator n=1 Tax=Candidatus Bealeia paramacronuclearis TaxID=1921001 RepID=A0ABZ2C5B9_9PROT|nr:BolA family transcriptional regulator [Candidatus Bealeia paramacronuclearis]
MAIPQSELEKLLNIAFPNSQILVQDLMGDQDHYKATIVSDLFQGKSRLQQHQMVYRALGDVMVSTLHALTLDTKVPSEGSKR